VRYESAPSILEQAEEIEFKNCGDSTYFSTELYGFVEQDVNLSKFWSAHIGVRLNTFLGADTNYVYVQPRLNLSYKDFPHLFSMDYSRMNQFLHLLVNPSSGLPSDLWVPSTSTISPELSNLFSANYTYSKNENYRFKLGFFYRTYDNLIEYSNPTELIQVQVNQSQFNFNTENIPWQDRVVTSKGLSYGMELNLSGKIKQTNFVLAYTLSRSERTIFEKNKEVTFPYKYDRPHNLAITALRKIGEKGSLQLNFAFGNGLRWTIPDQTEITSGGTIIVASKRNNARLGKYYHHLDVSFTTKKTLLREDDLTLTFGLYNIYNKRNPFYGYLLDGGEPGIARVKEISLYPIFPQINARFTW